MSNKQIKLGNGVINVKKQAVPKIEFKEALKHLEDKVILPTKHWSHLKPQMHARAFMVTGAMKHDLLVDMHKAIIDAKKDGGITDFRKNFKPICEKYGWSPNNTKNWRADIIYDTNVSMAYNAGRHEQMQRLKHVRPYWKYIAVIDDRTRASHRELHGQTHHADSAFWDAYYPPNGWKCRCSVYAMHKEDVEAAGIKVEPMIDDVNDIPKQQKFIKVDGKLKAVELPKGIDYGFNTNVGKASFGQILPKEAFDQKRLSLKGQKEWQSLTKGDWKSHNRSEIIPVDKAKAALFRPIDGSLKDAAKKAQMATLIKQSLGMKNDIEIIETAAGKVVIDAKMLGDHLQISRAPQLALLKELLEDPYEVWQAFEESKITGKIEIRRRFIKVVDTGKDQSIALIASSYKGQITGWTFIPLKRNPNKQRFGDLLVGREEGLD